MTVEHEPLNLSSDFVTNSYGESWDSSCREKSWAQSKTIESKFKQQWVLNWKCTRLYVTTVDHIWTSPQRPPWGQKKVAFVGRFKTRVNVWTVCPPKKWPFRRGSRILKWGANFCNNVIEPKRGWGVWGLCISMIDFRQSRQTWPGRRQRNVAKAWKRGVFGLHAGQCVCGLKMNKLIGRTSHRLCTFSTSIREIREIKYYFNIWGVREKKKKERRGLRKRGGGGENSPISPPLDPYLPF